MSEEYDYLFKSIVVGDGGVGKTALTLRFSKDFFTEDYKMTIGVDFHVKTITIDTAEGPIKAKLQLWDTGGQERFSSIRPMYYRGSLGAVLVFDLTNSSSFEHLPQWIEEVRANIKTEIPLLLVGNKSDLMDQRTVSLTEINNFTRDFNLYYMETSAKTGEGVGDCFYILACLMIGQGVPDQLITDGTVYSPGQIALESVQPKPTTIEKPLEDYAAPPVPEPNNLYEKSLDNYAAPPVPEPQINYEAPPVPKLKIEENNVPTIQAEPEPDILIPDPKELDFKTPDEILNTENVDTPQEPILESSSEETYKPKAVPFSAATPIPAPPPEGFKTAESQKIEEKSTSAAPFRVVKKEESLEPKPAVTTFTADQSEDSKATSSNNLSDYMPETILSKKERKKLEKKKKKEKKKRKLEEEKAKQENLLKQMKKGKESDKKKESASPSSKTSSLFQTLTQKTEEDQEIVEDSFIPFTSSEEKEKSQEEKSSLRIIPNAEDMEPEMSSFTAIESNSIPTKQEPEQKEFLICEQCGATLSSDYAFCNKCGKKLK